MTIGLCRFHHRDKLFARVVGPGHPLVATLIPSSLFHLGILA